MRSGTVSNEDRSTLSQIKNLMDRRRETYGRVFSRSLAIRRPDSGWTHALTRFDVLSNGAPAPQERRWEYEDAMLVTRGMSQAQLIESLEQLIERGELHLSDLPTFRVEGNFSWNELLPSRSPSFGLDWPASHYQFRQVESAQLPGQPLTSIKNPVFTNPTALVREMIGLDSGRGVGTIDILLPNYVARFERITLGWRHVSIVVRSERLPLESLLAKIHVNERWGRRDAHADILFENETQVMPLDFTSGEVYVALLSKRDGELLDFRHIHTAAIEGNNLPADVELELPPEEEIEALIRRGENERVEFKLRVGQEAKLAETVVAFSNGGGGIVLIGVDDAGNILGCDDAENSLRNILRHHCEPPITPSIEGREVSGKRVVVVRVREGADKPYTLRDKGVIVRAGSTDRVATRDELDAFYVGKQNEGPFRLG